MVRQRIRGSHRVDVPALLRFIKEAGIIESQFFQLSGIKKDTWLRIKRGQAHVEPATADLLQKALASLQSTDGTRSAIQSILVELPRGHVKLIGDVGETREKLRLAASAHGVTTLVYLVDLFREHDDPLIALAGKKSVPA